MAARRLFMGTEELPANQPVWRYVDEEGAVQGSFKPEWMVKVRQSGLGFGATVRACRWPQLVHLSLLQRAQVRRLCDA
jgi:hypothetical protein